MNPDLDRLKPYPFERLQRLLADVQPPAGLAPIALSIGEPKHPAPPLVLQALAEQLNDLARYPTTKGLPELRQAIAGWACQRFDLGATGLDADTQILPVNGTREALFAFAQAAIDRKPDARVICPNPFYQIYEGAALLAGAMPLYLPCLAEHHYLPDFDQVTDAQWRACQLVFLCSPGNPTGAVIPEAQLRHLLELSDQYGFVIASDECYSEIYCDEAKPPLGLLAACKRAGRDDFKNCVVFHSLSKRSNLPGLRSGFVAGDADLIKGFLRYRTYHGCAMSLPTQMASIAAWQDEHHVRDNREQYRAKFTQVLDILQPVMTVSQTDASFYLWPQTPIDDATFAKQLFAEQAVTVLPGSYLSRDVDGVNPGANHVRMALVAPIAECVEAARRIRAFIEGL